MKAKDGFSKAPGRICRKSVFCSDARLNSCYTLQQEDLGRFVNIVKHFEGGKKQI
jgi:hypothetical protein